MFVCLVMGRTSPEPCQWDVAPLVLGITAESHPFIFETTLAAQRSLDIGNGNVRADREFYKFLNKNTKALFMLAGLRFREIPS